MRTYLGITCILFALLVLAHVSRIIMGERHLATDPWFVLTTAIAAALSLWAWRLLRGLGREAKP